MSLPDKPSELIRLALGDLVKCANNPNYAIVMDVWHEPWSSACHVCLAGAVMAQSLNAPRDAAFQPQDFPEITEKLCALDRLRVGDVGEASEYLKLPLLGDLDLDRVIIPYGQDPGAFMADMRELADDLEQAGY